VPKGKMTAKALWVSLGELFMTSPAFSSSVFASSSWVVNTVGCIGGGHAHVGAGLTAPPHWAE